jgi:hypothetical protein
MKRKISAVFIFAVLWSQFAWGQTEVRPRTRDLGIQMGSIGGSVKITEHHGAGF